MTEPICAGFGIVDITPETDGTFDVLDPIYVRALHFRQGAQQVTLLAADLFMLSDDFRADAGRQVADLGVEPDGILTGASHLGTTPIRFYDYLLQRNPSLRHFDREARYVNAAAAAIRMAVNDLAPASLRIGFAETPEDLAHNRRAYDQDGNFVFVTMSKWLSAPEHLKYTRYDRQLGVLFGDRKGKRPFAMINYGCHALCLCPQKLGHISGDYSGRLCQRLGEQGVDALFFQGALGDVAPNRRGEDPADHLAGALAGLVQEAIDSSEPVEPPVLKRVEQTVLIPLQTLPEREAARERYEEVAREKGDDNIIRYRYWLAQRFEGQATYPYTMRAFSLGSTAFLFIPGEPLSSTALSIREHGGFDRLMVLASPCPEAGYLATSLAHEEGGTEADLSVYDADSEPEIRELGVTTLRKLAETG